MVQKDKIPPTAKPRHEAFDPWNSSSTGHQRAENRLAGSTGWRDSRSMKLAHQFGSGESGGKRIHDQVGAGSLDWDENAKALISKDIRERAQVSIMDMLQTKKQVTATSSKHSSKYGIGAIPPNVNKQNDPMEHHSRQGIFRNLVFFVNGSTAPLVSDHKLKKLITENGGRVSIHLGRKEVTHVILGSSGEATGPGAGIRGSLAGSKLHKEIQRVGGSGVKFVGVEWVLESIKAGKRISESPFGFKFAAKNQRSVWDLMKKG